jgi:predicted ATPase/transcriptional regulator with XRE-family HTH domain
MLRALREGRGISQDGWAARLGYSRKTVHRWEHGGTVPDQAAEEAILAACREYGLFRRVAAGPLAGVTLSEDLVRDALAAARLAGRPDAPLPLPIRLLEAAPSRSFALPAPRTSFVGRREEIAAVARLLGGTRLLTLTGPGGVGKTRLALAVAESVGDDYADGVVFVDLAPIAGPSLVIPAIARALGVPETAAQPIREALLTFLRPRRLLVVLDNFEHLLGAAHELGELLGAAPGLVLLITSREAVCVTGEQLYPVLPLPVPEHGPASPASLEGNPAVTLFVDRARLVRPAFALADADAPTVAEICRRLDGLPLAIELAAARITVLTPRALLERLAGAHGRAPLLTGGNRDLPERQRTLRGTIAWSHDLLTERERALFRHLAVFAGGCTLEAAEALCAVDGDHGTAVLDGLASLVAKSLLRQDEGVAGEPRFTMLETVREFAGEQLAASGEESALVWRHAAYVLRFVERCDRGLRSADFRGWMARLDQDHDNVSAALGRCIARQDIETGARLAFLLTTYWTRHGRLTEGRRWVEALLAAMPTASTGSAHARLLAVAGWVAAQQGDFEIGSERLRESAARAGELGDAGLRATALAHLGWVLWQRRDFDEARGALEESIALARAVGDQTVLANALSRLGNIYVWPVEDGDAARACYAESVRIYRELGDIIPIEGVLVGLASLAERRGAFGEARTTYEEVARQAEATGGSNNTVAALTSLGLLALLDGDVDRGEGYAIASLQLGRRLGLPQHASDCLAALGAVALRRGRSERAARLGGAAEAHRRRLTEARSGLHSAHRTLQQATWDEARIALGEEAFAAAWEEGRALSRDAAVALALEQGGAT